MADDKVDQLIKRVEQLEESVERRFYISMLGVIAALFVGVIVWWNLSGSITVLGHLVKMHVQATQGKPQDQKEAPKVDPVTPEATEPAE